MFTSRSSTCLALAATVLLAGCGQGDNAASADEAAVRTRPVARFELTPAAADAPAPAPAPVAQETAPPIVTGNETPTQTVAAVDSSAEPAETVPTQPTPVAAPAANAEALAQARGCFACHRTDTKLIGPAYKDVAAKYTGQDVVDTLIGKVIKGGAGVWGQMPMAPNNIPPEEARQLVVWILSQK